MRVYAVMATSVSKCSASSDKSAEDLVVLPTGACSSGGDVADAPVSLDDVLATMEKLGLSDHAERVAGCVIDDCFEDGVPLSSVAKVLRKAGLPPTQALAVRTALRAGALPPLVCATQHAGDTFCPDLSAQCFSSLQIVSSSLVC